MKKLVFLLVTITITFFSCNTDNSDDQDQQANCDNGTFIGMITLETQQEVNAFGALCYTKIDGTLNIIDLETESDKITDLSPLTSLKEIYTVTYQDSLAGTLRIRTSLLSNLQGLNNVEKVSRLIISNNENLITLEGLNGLKYIDGQSDYYRLSELTIMQNEALINLDGLDNLIHIGIDDYYCKFDIIYNPSLENIDGLSSLIKVGTPNSNSSDRFSPLRYNINIHNNHSLQNLDGLSSLIDLYVTMTFFLVGLNGESPPVGIVIGNKSLTDYCGLQNLVVNGEYAEYAEYGEYSVRTSGGDNYDSFSPTIQDIIDGNCSQ
jgi:hypothetical protein